MKRIPLLARFVGARINDVKQGVTKSSFRPSERSE
jgi:hypothetical protein